jgi:hypothetical protein
MRSAVNKGIRRNSRIDVRSVVQVLCVYTTLLKVLHMCNASLSPCNGTLCPSAYERLLEATIY